MCMNNKLFQHYDIYQQGNQGKPGDFKMKYQKQRSLKEFDNGKNNRFICEALRA